MTTQTTRRAILASAAAMPALWLPAFADPMPDPIFAAIEKHLQLYTARMAACRVEAEAAHGNPRRSQIEAAAAKDDVASDEAAEPVVL